MNKDEMSKTSKEIRALIIWAKSEIDEYKEFIKLCEKKIKEIYNQRITMKDEQICFRCATPKKKAKEYSCYRKKHTWIIDGEICVSTKTGKTKVIKL